MVKYDDELEQYVLKYKDMIFCWDDEPDEDQIETAGELRKSYNKNKKNIAKAIYEDSIKDIFGEMDLDEVIEKLGIPQIEPEAGEVAYCEQTFDYEHVISFEFMDDFEEIDNIALNG